jgi:hypothetical protein
MKIYEKVLLNKIKYFSSNILSFGAYQTGFKEGKNTHYNLTRLLESINYTRRKRSKREAYLFVDLRKAYDSVNKNILFNILWDRCKNDDERRLVSLIV